MKCMLSLRAQHYYIYGPENMKRINQILISLLHYFTMILFLVMLFIVFMQVILRYFVGSSMSGSEEAARYILFFLVLFGTSICVYDKTHLSIEYFQDKLSRSFKIISNLVISVSIVLASLIFIYYGWELATRSMNQTTPSLQIPRGWIFMAFPVAGFLMFYFQVQHFIKIGREEE